MLCVSRVRHFVFLATCCTCVIFDAISYIDGIGVAQASS